MFPIQSEQLRERFLKDNNVSIKFLKSPYFEDRYDLYNKYYNLNEVLESFLSVYNKVGNEEKYFELYNKLKDDVINYLNSSPEMLFFAREEDMSKFTIKNKNLPKASIYKPSNHERIFISIDMKSANFTALRHYNSLIVKNKDTYEDFLREFTDIDYFTKSKYIRQVVFGNVNPSRQISYEKYLMDKVVITLSEFIDIEHFVSFQNDEIILDVTEMILKENFSETISKIKKILNDFKKEGIILKFELFELRKIENTDGYLKKMLPESDKDGIVFKGLNSLEMPFVLRKHFDEEPIDSDFYFLHEGRMAKLLEPIVPIL